MKEQHTFLPGILASNFGIVLAARVADRGRVELARAKRFHPTSVARTKPVPAFANGPARDVLEGR